ncbi:MAG: ABC transporter permease subunit, partial [Thermomicrobiales bacterium]
MIGWLDANLISIVDGVAFGLLLFTLAIGLSLVFGMMDVLNLAHGTLYLAGAYLAYQFSDGSWFGLLLALLAGLAVGVVGGSALAAMTQPLTHRGHLDQALLTLGISFIVADLFVVAYGGEVLPASPPDALDGSVQLAGHTYPIYRLVFIGVASALA